MNSAGTQMIFLSLIEQYFLLLNVFYAKYSGEGKLPKIENEG